MIKKEDKKGSHVGVMISFVIFVTFIIFVYAVVQPAVISHKDKEAMLDFLELGIRNRISYEMTTGTAYILYPVSQNCVELDGIRTALNIGTKVSARNDMGEGIAVYLSPSDSNDLKILRTSVSNNLLKISYSEGFNTAGTNTMSCAVLGKDSGYKLGTTQTQEYVFQTKMIELIGEYSNYEVLKSQLAIPEGVEFGFGMVLSDGTEIYTNGNEPSTDIYIKESSITYIDAGGNIRIGYLKTKIW